MITPMEHLIKLARKNRQPELKPTEFKDAVRQLMGEVWNLPGTNRTTKFVDADQKLTSLVDEYSKKPDQAVYGRIKNAIVRYKTEATQSH
jgi:hypothetical protein